MVDRLQSPPRSEYRSRPGAVKPTLRFVSLIDTDHPVDHNAAMSQPLPPPQASHPQASGGPQGSPEQPYGLPPGAPSPSISPYAAFAHRSSPRAVPPADYPYLQHRGQTAVPTQPMAQHLSSTGQPASGLVVGGTSPEPYQAVPTATFPRSVRVPSPAAVTAAPQPLAQPQLASPPVPSTTRLVASSASTPWRRDRVIALIATLLACGTLLVWTLIDASKHPSFHTDEGLTMLFFVDLVFYILHTPGAWWLILGLLPLIAICRDRPTAVPAAAALQLFLIDVLIFNNSPISNPLPILCLLMMASATIATTSMNQRTRSPWPWPVTLGLSVNLFILVSMFHRLTKSLLYAPHNYDTQSATIGLWMVPSPSSKYPGTPYILGILLTIIITTISAITLHVGHRPSRRPVFAKLCGIAPMFIALHNIYILSTFGLSGASVSSALGLTTIGQGSHPHAAFRAWVASILLGLIAVGVTVLLNRHSPTRSPIQMGQGVPAVAAAQPRYQNYRPYAR